MTFNSETKRMLWKFSNAITAYEDGMPCLTTKAAVIGVVLITLLSVIALWWA